MQICLRVAWYNYQILIVICVLFCKVCVIILWMEGWSDADTGWTKIHLSVIQCELN
jgi:hypothetical protein